MNILTKNVKSGLYVHLLCNFRQTVSVLNVLSFIYILIIQTYKYIFYTHCSPSSQLLEESQQFQVWKATARLWKRSREFCSLLPFKDPKIQALTYLMRKKFLLKQVFEKTSFFQKMWSNNLFQEECFLQFVGQVFSKRDIFHFLCFTWRCYLFCTG